MIDAQEPLLGKLDSLDALRAWRDQAVAIERRLHCKGDCPIAALAGELAEVDPDRLALALLAAHQGGLVLTQVRRDPAPLEAALDAMIDHVAELLSQRGSKLRRCRRNEPRSVGE